MAEPNAFVLFLGSITLEIVQEKLLATLVTKEGWISILRLFLVDPEPFGAKSGVFELGLKVCLLLKVLVDTFVQNFIDKAEDFRIVFGH